MHLSVLLSDLLLQAVRFGLLLIRCLLLLLELCFCSFLLLTITHRLDGLLVLPHFLSCLDCCCLCFSFFVQALCKFLLCLGIFDIFLKLGLGSILLLPIRHRLDCFLLCLDLLSCLLSFCGCFSFLLLRRLHILSTRCLMIRCRGSLSFTISSCMP